VAALTPGVPRARLLAGLARLVDSRRRPDRVLRVAIDGPDAAGKTMLADALAARLAGQAAARGPIGRGPIRVSIDDFHRPQAVRYRRGPLSPEGYVEDSFDFDAVRRLVLGPLGPGGSGWYRPAAYAYRADSPRTPPLQRAEPGAVLLFDGVFLLGAHLRGCWDLCVFLDVSPDEAVRRAVERDAELFGGATEVRDRYRRRYLPGQQIYRAAASPESTADVVIDNTDLARPRVLSWPGGFPSR
jgi:uridine kinase